MIHVIDTPTTGKRIAVEIASDCGGHATFTGQMEEIIQRRANTGWNFVGVIGEYIPTGSVASHTRDLLFTKEPELALAPEGLIKPKPLRPR